MSTLIYWLALGLVSLLQALPLTLVAWLGRRMGALAYWLDRRHRRVAVENLTLAFRTEKTPEEIRALAREHFRRLGENYASAIKTASMNGALLARHVQFIGARKLLPSSELEPLKTRIMAIGHFGNFELAYRHFVPGYETATTYRALAQPQLDGLLRRLRERTGCHVFERRQQGAALREAMRGPPLLVGLLSDQHAGRAGLWLPFFGRECSTLAAPAIFALRYKMPLHTAFCFRVGPARWRIEIGDEIPTRCDGRRRSLEAIMADVNQAFEQAVRRDPANWFWVHRRWKTEKVRPRPKAIEELPINE